MCVCVCDNLNWMENGWMDWIEWMWKVDVESGKWIVARFRISHYYRLKGNNFLLWQSGAYAGIDGRECSYFYSIPSLPSSPSSLLLPFPPFFFASLPFPRSLSLPTSFPFSLLPFFPSLSLPSLLLEVGPLKPARGYGERCKLPQRGPGRSPDRNRIWRTLELLESHW